MALGSTGQTWCPLQYLASNVQNGHDAHNLKWRSLLDSMEEAGSRQPASPKRRPKTNEPEDG